MLRRLHFTRLFPFVIAILLFTSCNDKKEKSPTPNQQETSPDFEGSVSGKFNKDLKGQASFKHSTSVQTDSFEKEYGELKIKVKPEQGDFSLEITIVKESKNNRIEEGVYDLGQIVADIPVGVLKTGAEVDLKFASRPTYTSSLVEGGGNVIINQISDNAVEGELKDIKMYTFQEWRSASTDRDVDFPEEHTPIILNGKFKVENSK